MLRKPAEPCLFINLFLMRRLPPTHPIVLKEIDIMHHFVDYK